MILGFNESLERDAAKKRADAIYSILLKIGSYALMASLIALLVWCAYIGAGKVL